MMYELKEKCLINIIYLIGYCNFYMFEVFINFKYIVFNYEY